MHEIIFLTPVLKQMIWGGSRLSEYGYNLPSDKIGEAWVISAHPSGDCEIKGGLFNGTHLSELWKNHRELFGNVGGDKFPLLTKILDANDDLSIQVHPDDKYAFEHENGAFGKAECWYILDAKPNTKIIIGHNAKNHFEVESMIKQKRWNDFIREIPVKKGDFLLISPGTVHAIKGGTLLLETQQNSDITYRVYDYDRLSNGKLRELHIDKSIDVITSPFVEENSPKNNLEQNKTSNKNFFELCSCDYFTVWKLDIKSNTEIIQDQKFMLFSVIEGDGYIDGHNIKKGSNFILPFEYGKASFSGNLEIVVSSI